MHHFMEAKDLYSFPINVEKVCSVFKFYSILSSGQFENHFKYKKKELFI